LLIFCTYVPLNFLFSLCFPPKETKSKDLSPIDGVEQTPEQKAEAAAAAKA